jgi:Mor family transcriptional regulator
VAKKPYKFTKEIELEICKDYKVMGQKALAKKYNCGATTIRDILIRNNSLNKDV